MPSSGSITQRHPVEAGARCPPRRGSRRRATRRQTLDDQLLAGEVDVGDEVVRMGLRPDHDAAPALDLEPPGSDGQVDGQVTSACSSRSTRQRCHGPRGRAVPHTVSDGVRGEELPTSRCSRAGRGDRCRTRPRARRTRRGPGLRPRQYSSCLRPRAEYHRVTVYGARRWRLLGGAGTGDAQRITGTVGARGVVREPLLGHQAAAASRDHRVRRALEDDQRRHPRAGRRGGHRAAAAHGAQRIAGRCSPTGTPEPSARRPRRTRPDRWRPGSAPSLPRPRCPAA